MEKSFWIRNFHFYYLVLFYSSSINTQAIYTHFSTFQWPLRITLNCMYNGIINFYWHIERTLRKFSCPSILIIRTCVYAYANSLIQTWFLNHILSEFYLRESGENITKGEIKGSMNMAKKKGRSGEKNLRYFWSLNKRGKNVPQSAEG